MVQQLLLVNMAQFFERHVEPKLLVKVWNAEKTKGFMVKSSSYDELVGKVGTKFELGERPQLFFEDGVTIDEESYSVLGYGDVVTARRSARSSGLEPNEPTTPTNDNTYESTTPTTSKLIDIVKHLREKRKTSVNILGSKRQKQQQCTLHIGWMLYSPENGKYTQVRSVSGGGTRSVQFLFEDSYDTVMTRAIELFFPNGHSKKGRASDFQHSLGDFKQTMIPRANFTVGGYRSDNCLTMRPRIYLLSKEHVLFDPINIDSDDLDSEVDIGFFEHESDEPQNRIVQSDGQNPLDLPYTQAQPSTSGDQSHSDNKNILPDHDYLDPDVSSPVNTNWPKIPSCIICKDDRYCDSFLINCGHTLCYVCAVELEERGSKCHVCREEFVKIGKLFY